MAINLIESTTVSPKAENHNDKKEEDLSAHGTNPAALIHSIQGANPLGIGHYPLGLYGHRPLPTGLLLNSLTNPLLANPAFNLGYGGIPYNLLFYGDPYFNRDPLIGLILKQYGKYLPYGIGSYGLYGYSVPDTFQHFSSNKYERKL